MNEKLELGKLQLGNEESQLPSSKSLITTIDLGYNAKPPTPPPEIKINLKEDSSVDTSFDTGLEKEVAISLPAKEEPKFIEDDSLITSVMTGFESNVEEIPPPEIELKCKKPKCKNPDSIIEKVDTGFGCSNQVVVDCPKPKYKSHLCKENYLNEFKTESEKTLARTNLGVYSKEEINDIVSKIVIENNNFVTKKEVQNMIADLDFVNSTMKSYVDYQIPDNLFKL